MPRPVPTFTTYVSPFHALVYKTMAQRGLSPIDVEIRAGGKPGRRQVQEHRAGKVFRRMPERGVLEGYAKALDLPIEKVMSAAYESVPGAAAVPTVRLDPSVLALLEELEPLSSAQRRKVLRAVREQVARL